MNLIRNIANLIKWRKRKDIQVGFMARVDKNTFLEGFNRIGRNSYANGCKLGLHSYIGTDCILNQVEVGRFSSIGDRVMIITGNHPTNQNISTSPMFYSCKPGVRAYAQDASFVEYNYAKDGFYVVIGHDVWIGSDVRIMHGVKIGNGAVIGSGAIVTEDIEPYSINVGVPAKKIKARFDENQIRSLTQIQWWNWDEETFKERAVCFQTPTDFIERFGGTNGEFKR